MSRDTRLVDVNEAIKKINGLCVDRNENWIGTDNQSFIDHADVIDILSDMPIAESAEVVHGRWKDRTVLRPEAHDVGSGYWEDVETYCSACGMIDYHDLRSRYCPECGAKMDLE